jgi:hypothetical protein
VTRRGTRRDRDDIMKALNVGAETADEIRRAMARDWPELWSPSFYARLRSSQR